MSAVTPARTTAGEATRQRLIDASYRLVTTRGYHATSMRHIAAEAGITAGSIYNHFTDKGEILTEVLLAYHPVMVVMPVLQHVEGSSAAELLRDAAHRLVQAVDASPGVLNLLYVELVELGGQHVTELLERVRPVVERFMDQVYGSGEDLRPADPLVLFRGLVGQLLGYYLTRVAASAGQGRAAELDEFVDLLLHGALRHPSESRSWPGGAGPPETGGSR